jgi:Ca2+-binding RTX toxin-like protein
VVVKAAPIGTNTVTICNAHASVDITGGIGVNTIVLGVFATPSATAPQVVKITTDGIADGDSVTFVAGEDLSGLYATVTLSGVDTIQIDGVGTLALNASAVSGQTLTLGNGTDASDVTLSGTTSADTINLADITLAASATLSVTGGAGADTITAGAGVQTITGGAGSDTMTGGAGADVFDYAIKTEGGDTITDFVTASDVIQLLESAFVLADIDWNLHALDATTNLNNYKEVTAALTTTGVDMNGTQTTTGGGFVVVGAATGTAGVKVYYTTNLNAVTTTNSTLLVTLTGINTTGIAETDFLGL